MELELQKRIIENPKLYSHLKQNSHWVKLLNRDSLNIKNFESVMKEQYKERATDKVDEVLENMDLISTFLNAMK